MNVAITPYSFNQCLIINMYITAVGNVHEIQIDGKWLLYM